MSTEQDKDAFSLKRHRGGDGGLEGLGGPGVLLGPDKKKRKSNPQHQTPIFSTLTEYAPPPNPSADHLVAANPFDDGYNEPSFKPLSPGGPYFGHPQHPGLGGYGPPRMAPLMSHRMPSAYGGGLYQMRNQLHPFPQNQMSVGFSRPLGFQYGHQENPSFRNQPPFSNNMPLPPNHLFRPHPEDSLNQGPLHSVSQSTPPDHMGPGFGAEANPSGNPPLRSSTNSSPGFSQQENSFSQSNTPTPKPDSGDLPSKSSSQDPSPRKPSHTSEEVIGQNSSVDLKSKNRGPVAGQEGGPPAAAAEKRNGIIHPRSDAKKSPQTSPIEAAPLERSRAGGGGGSGGGGGGFSGGGLVSNKTGRHPNRSSHWSAEPVYPCGICLSEVNDDQEAILCEASCQKWFHRVCTGMTETAYNLLTAEVCAVWGCDACMEEKGAQLFRTKESTGQPALSIEG